MEKYELLDVLRQVGQENRNEERRKKKTFVNSMASSAKVGVFAFFLWKIFGPIIHLINSIIVRVFFYLLATIVAAKKYVQERLIKGNQDFKFSLNWGVKNKLLVAPDAPPTADSIFKSYLKQWDDSGKPRPAAGKQLELKEAIRDKMQRNIN